jgi:uncharacterized membrane protein
MVIKKTSIKHENIKALLQKEQENLAYIMDAIKTRESLAENINDAFDGQETFGERLADKVAAFVGSRRFIISFLAILALWMFVNAIIL